jgi:signal transduction histidine kinase
MNSDRGTVGQASLDEELLDIIASQVRSFPYTVVLFMGVIAYMIYGHLPDQPWTWGGWLGAVIASQLYRAYRLPKLARETHKPAARRAREAAAINFAGTAIQCLSLLAFPLFTPFEASVQTMMFVGIGVGSIVTALGWTPFTLTHVLLCLLPMFSLWGWSGVYGSAGTLGILVAVVGLAYSTTIWLAGKRLFQMNRDFYANRAALADALDEAERAGAAKTRFLAAASHDLRQPIHTLSLFSGALNMRRLDSRTRHISENIDGAVKALSSQLDALLDMSKLDAGVVPVNREKMDLAALLHRLEEGIRDVARAAGIEIRRRCPPEAHTITDEALLERILSNILTNAVTYNTDCALEIDVEPLGDDWQLTIADTGAGIDPKEHPHIFEEFYQVQVPGRERGRGLGLGLSIVARLASLLDLKMTFRSQPGQGTAFGFTLPRVDVTLSHLPEEREPGGPLSGIRALVVDDEKTVRDGMRLLLEMLGCEVDLAHGTDGALACARAAVPNIALVDYRLRGKDSGLHTIRRLREECPDLPAIIISGDTGPERLREARTAGVMLLSKPVDRDSLHDAIAITCDR